MGKRILVIGDVMLDHYLIGQSNRLSQEAPVPIVNIQHDYHSAGGAANLATNLSNIGAEVNLIGAVGDDYEGKLLTQLLSKSSILFHPIIAPIQTTVKTRVLVGNQQMLRIDREDHINEEALIWEKCQNLLSSVEFDIVLISDYGKGLCYPSLCQNVISTCKKKNIKVLVDPKGVNWAKYSGSYLIKPNRNELEEISGPIANDKSLLAICTNLSAEINIPHIAITLGKKGIVHVHKSIMKEYPASEVEIFDVSGAGDTAMAALSYELCMGNDLDTALKMANKAAGFAVSKSRTYALSLDDYTMIKMQ